MKTASRALVLLALAGASFWVWEPVLRMSFVSDSFMLPLLLGPGGEVDWAGVLAEFYRPWLGMADAANWRPVVTAHFALDLWAFGADPLGFHLSNLACHLASGLVVFALIRRAAPRAGQFAAWVGAFLYLVHPARPEAIAWVVGRVDGTAALFTHLALLAFLVSGERRGASRLLCAGLSLGLALAAYGSKEMALALPASLLFLCWFRAPGLRPPWGLLVLHALLLGAVVVWRVRILGGVAGGAGLTALASDYVAGLPAKFGAAFFPETAGSALVRGVAWVALPLVAGWVRGPAALRALPCLVWWALLLAPSSQIALYPDGSGSRQLLLPALAGGVLVAVVLGRPALGRDLWPGNAMRWAAGGAMCALAVLGARERIQDWREAGSLADRARTAIAARTREPGEGPLAIASLPVRPTGSVQPFRNDCAFLAFRRPFAAEDQESVILDNVLGWADTGPLHQASSFSRELLAWLPGPGAFLDLKAETRADERVALTDLVYDTPQARLTEKGLLLAGGEGWTWLSLPDLIRSSASLEGLDLLLERATGELEVVLAWAHPGKAKGFPIPGSDPTGMGPYQHARFYPLDASRTLWRCSAGNLAGFFGLQLLGGPIPMALAFRGPAHLLSLDWRGRLPRTDWTRPAGTTTGPKRPTLPVPPRFLGPCRLVLLSSARVVEVFYLGQGQEEEALGPEAIGILAFLARALSRHRVYYYVDRLAEPGARHATLERTHVHSVDLFGW